MKKILTDYKKETIVIAILLVILVSLIGIALIEPKNKDNTNIKENIDTENKEEIKSEENKEEVETEKDKPTEEPKEEIKEEPEDPKEPTNEEKEEQKTEQTKPDNNNNTSKPNNTTPDKNETTNNDKVNNESNDSNNTGNSTNNNTTDKSETETINKPVEVTTNTINLNNYNSDIKITNGGTYTLTGTLNYSIFIEADSKVTLNLNGVTVKAKKTAAIANITTKELEININSGTTNNLSDGGPGSGDYDGCIFSYGALTLGGAGYLTVNGKQVDGEGIATKNAPITINGGNINIISTDDGINTGGDGGTITLNNGIVTIEAGGDGVDSNKDIVINGGTIHSVGASAGADSGLDADKGIVINGGTVIATGASLIEPPESTSKQKILAFAFKSMNSSATIYTLLDSNDNVIVSFKSVDKFSTLIISSDKLVNGTYYLYKGGNNTGTLINGMYTGGTYTKGTILDIDNNTEFVVEDIINIYSSVNAMSSENPEITNANEVEENDTNQIKNPKTSDIINLCLLSIITVILIIFLQKRISLN